MDEFAAEVIQLEAEGNRLRLVQETVITSGCVDSIAVSFRFSPHWDGLDRVAVFRSPRAAMDVVLDGANQCFVPHEVLERPGGTLRIGIYGVRGSERVLSTVWCECGPIRPGTDPAGQLSQPAQEGALARMLKHYADARDLAQSVRDDADAGRFHGRAFTYADFTAEQLAGLKGEPGVPGEKGEPGQYGQDGYTPVRGVDYWTQADKAAIVQEVLATLPVYQGGVV